MEAPGAGHTSPLLNSAASSLLTLATASQDASGVKGRQGGAQPAHAQRITLPAGSGLAPFSVPSPQHSAQLSAAPMPAQQGVTLPSAGSLPDSLRGSVVLAMPVSSYLPASAAAAAAGAQQMGVPTPVAASGLGGSMGAQVVGVSTAQGLMLSPPGLASILQQVKRSGGGAGGSGGAGGNGGGLGAGAGNGIGAGGEQMGKPSRKEKTFECPHAGCAEVFNTRFSLGRHQKRHTGERPYVCKIADCNKKFAEKSTLTRHMRIHTGDKPYRCDFPNCGASFADRTNIKRHNLLHSGQRPFKCPHCEKDFIRRHHLTHHVHASHGAQREAAVVWPTQQSALQQVSGIPQRAEEPRGTRPESPLQGAQLPQMLTAPRPLRIP